MACPQYLKIGKDIKWELLENVEEDGEFNQSTTMCIVVVQESMYNKD